MQVTGITAAFTGTQPQQSFTSRLYGRSQSAEQPSFESYLYSQDTEILTNEQMSDAMERAIDRLTALVGQELAEDVVNEDGSVNLAQLARLMAAAEEPYGATDTVTFANTPQVVNLIA